MNLWIRTRDRAGILKCEKLYIQVLNGEFYILNENEFPLGTYKTRERALEVLDEIEERIMIINTISLAKDSVSLIAYKNALSEEKIKGIGYPYQMPKE